MAEPPQVSVVTPTRDRWPLLANALRGALGQEGVAIEVIVIDDGSEDAAPLAAIADARVHIVRHERSRGVAAARNRGLSEARAPWVSFLDDDDLWSPRKLRAQMDAATSAGAAFAYASAIELDQNRQPIKPVAAPDAQSLTRALLQYNAIPAGASNVFARTSAVREAGGFDENLLHLADWDLWIRLALAHRGAACPDILVGYVQHPGSMRATYDRDVLGEFAYLADKHADHSREWGVELDRFGLCQWLATGHRHAGRRRDAARLYMRSAVEHRRPDNLIRGAAVLLGERVMRLAARSPDRPAVAAPDWLALYS
jgi:glycosyltransferase involved in cell wall biosynthesis